MGIVDHENIIYDDKKNCEMEVETQSQTKRDSVMPVDGLKLRLSRKTYNHVNGKSQRRFKNKLIVDGVQVKMKQYQRNHSQNENVSTDNKDVESNIKSSMGIVDHENIIYDDKKNCEMEVETGQLSLHYREESVSTLPLTSASRSSSVSSPDSQVNEHNGVDEDCLRNYGESPSTQSLDKFESPSPNIPQEQKHYQQQPRPREQQFHISSNNDNFALKAKQNGKETKSTKVSKSKRYVF
jgi:hypothetical protein